jgi:hypothetical protein
VNGHQLKERGWLPGNHNRHAGHAAFWKALRHRFARRMVRQQLREVTVTWA